MYGKCQELIVIMRGLYFVSLSLSMTCWFNSSAVILLHHTKLLLRCNHDVHADRDIIRDRAQQRKAITANGQVRMTFLFLWLMTTANMVLWDSFPCGIVLYIYRMHKQYIHSIFFLFFLVLFLKSLYKAWFRQDTFLNKKK